MGGLRRELWRISFLFFDRATLLLATDAPRRVLRRRDLSSYERALGRNRNVSLAGDRGERIIFPAGFSAANLSESFVRSSESAALRLKSAVRIQGRDYSLRIGDLCGDPNLSSAAPPGLSRWH